MLAAGAGDVSRPATSAALALFESSICGTDKARLTSAARVDVRAITPVGALRSESDDVAPNVWTWDVVLDAGTWSMEL